ncbi:hypothetical protein ACJX0J_006039, partial [Zea mays]
KFSFFKLVFYFCLIYQNSQHNREEGILMSQTFMGLIYPLWQAIYLPYSLPHTNAFRKQQKESSTNLASPLHRVTGLCGISQVELLVYGRGA